VSTPRRSSHRWPLSPVNRTEQAVFAGFAVVLLLLGWGGWALWQSMERHRATADETLRDHAAYIAQNYRGSYQTQTWFAVRTLLVAAQEASASPRRRPTGELVDSAVRRAIGPDVPALIPLRFFHRVNGQWHTTSTDGWVDVALRQALEAGIRDSLSYGSSYSTVIVKRSNDSSIAFVEPSRHDSTGWVGFEVAIADLADKVLLPPPRRTSVWLEHVLDSLGRLTPEAQRQLISARVVTSDSTTLLSYGPRISGGWEGSAPFWSSLPGEVVVTVGPGAALYFMPGGYPPAPGPRVAAVIALVLLLTSGTAWLVWRTLALARMRHEFTSSVSHELRTPLANIHLYAETLLLERATDPAARRAALETITREARRLGAMVENVLASAQMARAEERIEVRPEELGRLVGEVVDAFTPVLHSRSMKVEVEQVGPGIAVIDGGAVRRILVNLLDNAIRHGPDGQRLRVVVDHRGDSVLIVVEDEGPGIPMSQRERVWLPYARGENGGSGLGLAVVRYLARLHGGDAVVGDLDGGARIEVRLAAAEAG
jgi:signal transduction histidine kinase